MKDEKLEILSMLREGIISYEQAERLLLILRDMAKYRYEQEEEKGTASYKVEKTMNKFGVMLGSVAKTAEKLVNSEIRLNKKGEPIVRLTEEENGGELEAKLAGVREGLDETLGDINQNSLAKSIEMQEEPEKPSEEGSSGKPSEEKPSEEKPSEEKPSEEGSSGKPSEEKPSEEGSSGKPSEEKPAAAQRKSGNANNRNNRNNRKNNRKNTSN